MVIRIRNKINKINAFRSKLALLADLLYPGTFGMHFVPPETQRSKMGLLLGSLFPGVDGGGAVTHTQDETDSLLRWLKPLTTRLRGDIHAVKTTEGPSCRRSPLPAALLQAHLTGGAQVGLYFMAEGAHTTRVALFDLDSHKRATSWPEMLDAARRLSARATQHGLKAHAFRSSGGRGVHLIFLWNEPQHAYSVRRLLSDVLAAEGLAVGTGGVVASQVEVFPKQDIGSACGHMFILPLGGKSCPLELSADGDATVPKRAVLESWWKWQASDAVPVLERPAPRAVSADGLTLELQTVKAYCDLIPNEGEDELHYEDGPDGRSYLQLLIAVHRATDGSDEGFQIADEMARRSSKYVEGDGERRWDSITPREGGITVRTLINAARHYAPEAAHAIEMEGVEEGFETVEATPEDLAKKSEVVNKPLLCNIDSMRVGGFLDAPPPPRRFLFASLLPAATVALLGAAGGTGKSQFAIQAGLCLATGDALAGQWEVLEPGASLLLCSEDETEELHRRVHNTFAQMTSADDEETKHAKRAAVAGNVFVTSLVGSDARLLKQESRGGWSVDRARVQEIIAAAKQIPKLKMIVLDPASRFRGGDENDADGATRFIEVLERIRAATGALVLATAHVNKTSIKEDDPSNTAFRGSSGMTDSARMTFIMSTMTAAVANKKDVDQADRWKYVRVDTGKFNYGPPVREVWLKKGAGGFLHRTDVTKAAPEKAIADKEAASTLRARIVNLVRDRAQPKDGEDGKHYSVTKFRETFGGVDRLLGASTYELRALLPAMLKDGHLKEIRPAGARQTVLAPGDTPIEQDAFDELAADDITAR